MRKLTGIAVLLMVLLQTCAFAAAGDLVCPMDRNQAVEKMNAEHAKRIQAWTKVYNLTPEQSEKISKIMIKYRDKELDKKNDFVAGIVQTINESDKEIKSVLTPDQKDKYETAKFNENRDIAERIREWFSSGMCY